MLANSRPLGHAGISPATASWDDAANLPHSRPVLRQTQALIGFVLTTGVVAAYFVNLSWVVVPAIVGLGLIAAGLTGVCPMALLIARLPWNRSPQGSHPADRKPSCCGQ